MPFDGTDYQPPRWDDRLLRLADFTETLAGVNLYFWDDCAVGQVLRHGIFYDEGFRCSFDGLPVHWDGIRFRGFGWQAVASFFGMTHGHAHQVFAYRHPWDRPTPQEVARRIRAYCDMRWMAMAC